MRTHRTGPLVALGLVALAAQAQAAHFLALRPPGPVVDRLARVQAHLGRAAPPVDWSDPRGFHLTLAYLGDLAAADVEALRRALRPVLAATAPFTLVYRGLGHFPFKGRKLPRVLWAAPRGQLVALGRLQRALQDLGLRHGAPEPRFPFRPHVTLGRVQWPPRRTDLGVRMTAWQDRSFGGHRVEAVWLLESQSATPGVYREVERFPLAAQASASASASGTLAP